MVVSGRNHRVEIRFLSTKIIPLAQVLNTRHNRDTRYNRRKIKYKTEPYPCKSFFLLAGSFDADIMIWKEGNGGQWSERGSTSSAPCMIVTPSQK